MKNTKCIIIEDEFPASEILKSYLERIPNWSTAAIFENALDANDYLANHSVDVIFVDIKLPQLSGISFIRALEKPPIIVITTAYSEHAIEAFELVVFDYLLKPYSFERFVKTINRINHQSTNGSGVAKNVSTEEVHFIIVSENRAKIKLFLDEICYLESQKEYVLITCEDRIIKTKMGITKMVESLPEDIFLRIHRSFVVNMSKIDAHTNKTISVNNVSLPIGRYYQKHVRQKLMNVIY